MEDVCWDRIGVVMPASSWVKARELSSNSPVSFLSLRLPSSIWSCLYICVIRRVDCLNPPCLCDARRITLGNFELNPSFDM